MIPGVVALQARRGAPSPGPGPGPGPGGDCDPYTRPAPTFVATNLDTATTFPTPIPTTVETNLCTPVS